MKQREYGKSKTNTPNELIINLKKIDDMTRELFLLKDIKLDDLNPENRAILNKIVHTSYHLYNTKDYDHFHNIIKKYFNDMEKIIPRTVGAYMGGCLADTSLTKIDNISNHCSIIGNGIPKPSNRHKSPSEIYTENKTTTDLDMCNFNVVLADYTGAGFTFFSMNDFSPVDTMVYVSFDSYDSFPGFNKEEKIKLNDNHSYGKIILISYDETGKIYKDLIGKPVSIEQIKSRYIASDFEEKITTATEIRNLRNFLDNDKLFLILFISITLFLIFSISYIYLKCRTD